MSFRRIFAGLATSAALAVAPGTHAKEQARPRQEAATSDEALVRSLPGFSNRTAQVNGFRLHYVVGGRGTPLFLLPGWPETWWAYRKVMPELARKHRVYVIDIRGMGSSGKPANGYDKKTMASDIAALVRLSGYPRVAVIGHDIGAMVAYSFAQNYPELTDRLVLLDVGHPSAGYRNLKLLPEPGTFGDRVDEDHPYFWWFAFHQVKGLPEQLLQGRAGLEQAWFFRYQARNEWAIDARARRVYAAAYSTREGTRTGDAWYQSFDKDIADDATYGTFRMPVLGLGGSGYPRLKAALDVRAPGSRTIRVEGSGHFIAEEKPELLLQYLGDFLDTAPNAR
jgi:pimeloyl-ACP methyl ester carboxylesterase